MTHHSQHAPFTLYQADMSYFSGKLEAYMRYKQIPYTSRDVDLRVMYQEIHPSTGTRKVPAVKTADNLWLYDTTPTIEWFEAEYPAHSVYPSDPALAFVAALLEDYGDEWLWRPSMWWRWEYPLARQLLSARIGGLLGMGAWLNALYGKYYARRQRNEWLWKDGVTKQNAAKIKHMFVAELEFLQPLFEQQPYLLGSHPSVADYGYFGSMFRHFGTDPEPAELMRREAPAVYEWLARLWNAAPSQLGVQQWQWPQAEYWQPLLKRIAQDYLPYLTQNALAFQAQQERFDYVGESFSLSNTVTTDYRVWCRQELQRRYAALPIEAQLKVTELFADAGGLQALHEHGVIDAAVADKYQLPKQAKGPKDHKTSLKIMLLGQPRN